MTDPRETAAVATITEHVPLLRSGGWPEVDTLAHRLLHGTDTPMLALLAAMLVVETGDAGMAVTVTILGWRRPGGKPMTAARVNDQGNGSGHSGRYDRPVGKQAERRAEGQSRRGRLLTLNALPPACGQLERPPTSARTLLHGGRT